MSNEDSAATWTLRKNRYGSFTLRRNGEPIIDLGSPKAWAEGQLRQYREQEAEARALLASGDPLALCRAGWHRGRLPGPIAGQFSKGPYFRFGGQIGEAGGTLVFLVADQPFRYRERIVKCLGSLTPWTCAVCGATVPALAEE